MVAMPPSPEQIVERGRALYDQRIRPHVEPKHNGKFLILNVDTGEYEMDSDDVVASERAADRFPGAPLFAVRVGYPAAYHLGGIGGA